MSLSLALNSALSGLKVSQASLSVLANNTANANTPGYSRQVVEQSAVVLGRTGAGARIDQVVRKIDQYLTRAVQGQTTKVSGAEIISDYMSRLQIQMGEPGGTNSLDEYVENLFNMMQTLATSPETTSSTFQVAQAANIMAQEISGLAREMENMRYTADQDIRTAIGQVNEEILKLEEINESLGRAYALGDSTATFLDQRDASIRKLSEYMDIKFTEQESGQVYVYTTGGTPLLEQLPSRISYTGSTALDTFVNDGYLSPITIDAIKPSGEPVGRPVTVVSGGYNSDITTIFKNGKIKALLDVRDKEVPAMLNQLDQMAAKLRDETNAIHNRGSGVPPTSTLTGTRPIGGEDLSQWTGQVRIAALNPDGTVPASRYAADKYGQLPLTLDLGKLRGQYGNTLSAETIVKEINSYFTPQNHAVVGGFNNIAIGSLSSALPGSGTFEFDLDLQNIKDSASSLWVGAVRVFDDGGVAMTPVTTGYPVSVSLDNTNTFLTTANSNKITVNAAGHGLQEGDTIKLDNLSIVSLNGIPASELANHSFVVKNVTANSFEIEVTTKATASSPPGIGDATASLQKSYISVAPGETVRTGDKGTMSVDLSANTASQYYTVEVDVQVDDGTGTGNTVTSTVSYRISNNNPDALNNRFAATAVAGSGTLQLPTSSQPLVKALLVNEKGLPAGPLEKGYLKIVGQEVFGDKTKNYAIAIDDLTSKEMGRPYDTPPQPGTGKGFSHYFGLNDFFVANKTPGNTVNGSAYSMAVRADIMTNPNLISTGSLTKGLDSADPSRPSNYTYERTKGDNSIAQKLADLGIAQLKFDAAGGLSATSKTFNGYASEILGYAASRADTSATTLNDEESLMDNYQSSLEAVSGVNIDEEMANTIILQNAYSGSAQVINVVKELFDTLLNAV